jgi:hypothetical protein
MCPMRPNVPVHIHTADALYVVAVHVQSIRDPLRSSVDTPKRGRSTLRTSYACIGTAVSVHLVTLPQATADAVCWGSMSPRHRRTMLFRIMATVVCFGNRETIKRYVPHVIHGRLCSVMAASVGRVCPFQSRASGRRETARAFPRTRAKLTQGYVGNRGRAGIVQKRTPAAGWQSRPPLDTSVSGLV